jgi:hypothetical protein
LIVVSSFGVRETGPLPLNVKYRLVQHIGDGAVSLNKVSRLAAAFILPQG